MAWQLVFMDFEKLFNTKKFDLKLWLVFIGILLLIIGQFLPWVSEDQGEIGKFEYDGMDFHGMSVLFFAIIVLLLFLFDLKEDNKLLTPSSIISIENLPFTKKSLTRFLSFLISLLIFLIVIISLNDARDFASNISRFATFEASLGSGVLLSLIGALILPIAIFLQLRDEKESVFEEKKDIEVKTTVRKKKKSKSKMEIIGDFIEIPGIGQAKAEKLYDAGYHSLDELKSADIDDIAEVNGFTRVSAKRLMENL